MESRRSKVVYLQVTAAVVSLLLGLFNLSKESAPLVRRIQENRQHSVQERRQNEIVRKATEIANMGLEWQYRSNDGLWRYYSDPTGRYWCRVNIQGVYEYSENPQHQMASSGGRLLR